MNKYEKIEPISRVEAEAVIRGGKTEDNPNATRSQLLQKATDIDRKYGSQLNPPIGETRK